MRQLRIGMAQINTTVGDFVGNRRKILKAIAFHPELTDDLRLHSYFLSIVTNNSGKDRKDRDG